MSLPDAPYTWAAGLHIPVGIQIVSGAFTAERQHSFPESFTNLSDSRANPDGSKEICSTTRSARSRNTRKKLSDIVHWRRSKCTQREFEDGG